MPVTEERAAFEKGVEPILQIILPARAKAVMRYRAAGTLKARIEDLAAKSSAGKLSETERKEYTGYVRANKFVAILKRHAPALMPNGA